MRAQVFLFLLLCGGYLTAQEDPTYRRGWQIGIVLGLQPEPPAYALINNRIPTEELKDLSEYAPTNFEVVRGDTLVYSTERMVFAGQALRFTPRYNLQLRLHRRYLSGLEFVAGLFYASGEVGKERSFPELELTDYRYVTFTETYRRIGLVGGIHFNFMKNYRFQPYLGLGFNFLSDRYERSDFQKVLPAHGFTAPAYPLKIGVAASVFRFEMRPLLGFNYTLTRKFALGLEVAPTVEKYAGLQLRYRLTDY